MQKAKGIERSIAALQLQMMTAKTVADINKLRNEIFSTEELRWVAPGINILKHTGQQIAPIERVQQTLEPSTAILEYVVIEPQSYCLVVTHAGHRIVPLTAGSQLDRLVDNYRTAVRAKLPAHEEARALYDALLNPVPESVTKRAELQADLPDLIRSIKQQQLEGLVAKRRGSVYEAGQRSAAWQKIRINQGQGLVIGGYTVGRKTFDALVLGYYEDGKLLYASRTRNGFTPAIREQLYKRMRPLQAKECPFANLPERHGGRWGQGLTAAKMNDCCWLRSELVGHFEFVEWTPDGHLRHTRFVALREDKKATEVRREA